MRQQGFIANRDHKNMAIGLLSVGILYLVGWTIGGRDLGGCPSLRWVPMGWTRTNFARIWNLGESSRSSHKLISQKKDNFQPDMTSLIKSFESPYRFRCFAKFITVSKRFIMATFICGCFVIIIASSLPRSLSAEELFDQNTDANTAGHDCPTSVTWISFAPAYSRTRGSSPPSSRTCCLRRHLFSRWEQFQLKTLTFTTCRMCSQKSPLMRHSSFDVNLGCDHTTEVISACFSRPCDADHRGEHLLGDAEDGGDLYQLKSAVHLHNLRRGDLLLGDAEDGGRCAQPVPAFVCYLGWTCLL